MICRFIAMLIICNIKSVLDLLLHRTISVSALMRPPPSGTHCYVWHNIGTTIDLIIISLSHGYQGSLYFCFELYHTLTFSMGGYGLDSIWLWYIVDLKEFCLHSVSPPTTTSRNLYSQRRNCENGFHRLFL